MVMSLNNETVATIMINGEQGPIFDLQRSVRQGCPLVTYLFFFAADVLGYMLDDSKCRVEGLTLPDTSKLTNLIFADDTSVFLRGNSTNLQQTMQILAQYNKASRARLNWHKTIVLWASRQDQIWDWGYNLELKWKAKEEAARYLGFPIGFHMPQEESNNKVLQ